MTSIENPNQRNFALNNGGGEIPALGFGRWSRIARRREMPPRPRSRWGSATSTVPSGTATKRRSARHSRSCSPTARSAARTCS